MKSRKSSSAHGRKVGRIKSRQAVRRRRKVKRQGRAH